MFFKSTIALLTLCLYAEYKEYVGSYKIMLISKQRNFIPLQCTGTFLPCSNKNLNVPFKQTWSVTFIIVIRQLITSQLTTDLADLLLVQNF